jgi:hypothetical protein
MKNTITLLILALGLSQCATKTTESTVVTNSFAGIWKDDRGIAYQITEDSSITDNLSGQTGKVKITSSTEAGQSQIFKIVTSNNCCGERKIISMNDSVMVLSYYSADEGKVTLKKSRETQLSPFNGFATNFYEPSFLITPTDAVQEKTMRELMPNVIDLTEVWPVAKFGTYWICILKGGDFNEGDLNKRMYALTFDPANKSSAQSLQLCQWDGFCDANASVTRSNDTVNITVQIGCEGGDSTKSFTVDASGKITEAGR